MVKNNKSGWSEPTSEKSLLGLLTHQKWLQTHENGTASLAKHDYNVSGVFGGVWMAEVRKTWIFTMSPPWHQRPYGPLSLSLSHVSCPTDMMNGYKHIKTPRNDRIYA